MNSLGYRTIADTIGRGDDPYSCLDAVTRETQQYAKRQETFFRSEPDATWIDVSKEGWQSEATVRAYAWTRVNR
jgi:tRNA A37 N6-isopentenylltransferase MiaA